MSADEYRPIDVDPKDLKDESASSAPEGGQTPSSESGKPEGDDKFMEFTKKATSATEKAIGKGYSKVKKVLKDANFEPKKTIGMIDKLLGWAKEACPPESFESLSDWFAKYGHGGLVCAQVLTVLYWTIAAIGNRTPLWFFLGLAYCVLLIILQYTADKFLDAGDTLIRSSPSKLSSEAFLNCLALITVAAGVGAVVIGLMTKSLPLFIQGLGFAAICLSVAYIALNPSLANIEVSKDTAAGEEAIGILSFAVKAVVRIVPFAFGLGAIIGSIALLMATFSVLRGPDAIAGSPMKLVMVGASLPFASYILFTVYHLIIDVLRAILAIPGKLDKLHSDD